ncbi:hypothetical protein [Roseiflexus castenholzii]|uniref:hypothetical protein n=1 Tax=Roseiflexus castenholzii TaxID=120962 RepID=UPI003C7E0077
MVPFRCMRHPHQIEAALFAFRSPIAKGALLAAEGRLGKTIADGPVLCRFWGERRRRRSVIRPASMRPQRALDPSATFPLPTVILDAKECRERQAHGLSAPVAADEIVVTSMPFARPRAADVRTARRDRVVIDESYTLRNACRPSNRMGRTIRRALEDRRKALRTATSLQNSLVELYRISTIIDGRIFGDPIFTGSMLGST